MGGGILTMELAAKARAIPGPEGPGHRRTLERSHHAQGLPRGHCAGGRLVRCEGRHEFYERQLIKGGVKFVREHRGLRLWDVEECGEFPTMEGRPYRYGRTETLKHFQNVQGEYFSTCKGIVVENNHSQERSWIAAAASSYVWEMSPNSASVLFLDLALMINQSRSTRRVARLTHQATCLLLATSPRDPLPEEQSDV